MTKKTDFKGVRIDLEKKLGDEILHNCPALFERKYCFMSVSECEYKFKKNCSLFWTIKYREIQQRNEARNSI